MITLALNTKHVSVYLQQVQHRSMELFKSQLKIKVYKSSQENKK